MHKSSLLKDFIKGPSIWGVAESHLSSPGISQFQRELKYHASQIHYHAGAPAPLRTIAPTAIGGKQVGVGFLTTCPSRALVRTWSQEQHDSARILAHTFAYQNQWIHGAIFYGKASKAASPEVRQETDEALALLTTRIVRTMTGKRFIMGDFNQLPNSLSQPKLWYELGWREVQSLALSKLGIPIRPTCHRTTQKDYVWISPELVQHFKGIVFDDTTFPDHAIIGATFTPFGPPEMIPIWRQPRPIDLTDLTLQAQGYQADMEATTQQACVNLAAEYEKRVNQALQDKGKPPLLPNQCGRAQTLKPSLVPAYSRPVAVGRQGSFQAKFGGISF